MRVYKRGNDKSTMKKRTVIILSVILLSISAYFLIITQLRAKEPAAILERDNPVYMEPAVICYSLLPGEMVVNNYQELKNALEANNGITSVYFGNNITMQLGGIKINPNKQHVSVSGLNPLDSGQTEPYTLTDYSSSSFYDTIRIDIDSSGISTLTVHDMNIVGKNFYGPFSVFDTSALSGVSLIYERVNYNGPQLGYHRSGTIHVIDCTVRIHGGNGGSVNQEFSEAKHLVFQGANSIDTDSSANSIFWHPLGGSFTLDDNSSLSLTSPNTSALYGVFYADLYTNKIDIIIGERAQLDMTISGTVTSDTYATLNSLIVREAGGFKLKTTKAASATVLKVVGALTVEKEASFVIYGYGGSTASLLRQEGGDITIMKDATFHITSVNAYSSLLNLVGRSFICNDPSSVLLCNANRIISATTNVARIYIEAQQVNYWDALSADGLDSAALYRWENLSKSNFIIDGELSAGASGDFSNISSNYAPGDPPGEAPGSSNFSMKNARILAFGRLELTVVQPTVSSISINGVTKPGAAVRATFSQDGAEFILPDVTADSMGIFHIPVDISLKEGTVITVKSNLQFLTTTAAVVVGAGGRLEFFVPDTIEFFISEVTAHTQIIKRLHPGWEIVVSDGRGGSGWSLYARIDSELTPTDAGLPPLAGALVYIDDSGHHTTLNVNSDIPLISHMSPITEEIFSVSWAEDKGILISVKPGTAFVDTVYSASIIWTLIDAP